MFSDPYPKFDSNPINIPRAGASHKESGKKMPSAYKQLDSLNITFKNLKRSSERKEDDNIIKKFASKEEEIKRIINKFNANIEASELPKQAEEVNKRIKEIENKIFFNSKLFEDNNLNQIRNSLDRIPLEEYKKLSCELEKNKILNESLGEKKENEKDEGGFDINHIDIAMDQRKLIIEFVKKFRNIFLLQLEYKNIPKKTKDNLVKYLSNLISVGNKDCNVSAIDFEKLNKQAKNMHFNSADDLNKLKFISELVDTNILNRNVNNTSPNSYHANSFNVNDYSNKSELHGVLKNPPINLPNFGVSGGNYINQSLFSGVQQNQSNLDLFGTVVPNNNSNNININSVNCNSYHLDSRNSDQLGSQKNYGQINDFNYNNNPNAFDDFSLLRGNSSEINANFQALYPNHPNRNNDDYEKDKKLARKMLISEFKQAVNVFDLSFDMAENYFMGTDDLKYAVQNYYQNKYQEDNFKMIFKFPSGSEYTIVKEFTDSPSSIFDEIMNIIITKEKKEVYEFKLIQEGTRGLIDIDSNARFLGGLNIEKNKIINVKYEAN